MKLKLLPIAFLIVLLTACQSLDIPSPATFNQRALVGYTTVEAVANTATTLIESGKMSRADGRNVLESSQNAKTALDIAVSIYPSNPEIGVNKLQVALASLTALQTYLKGLQTP